MTDLQLEPFFVVSPFSQGVDLHLLEMVHRQTSPLQIEYVPARAVVSVELEDTIDSAGELPRPIARISFRRLQKLADDLAAIGVFPSKLPKATDHHLDDIRHSRDFNENLLETLVKKLK